MSTDPPSSPQDWSDWIAEAHSIISSWERDAPTYILSTRESVLLAERIAQAMHSAYLRGRGSPR